MAARGEAAPNAALHETDKRVQHRRAPSFLNRHGGGVSHPKWLSRHLTTRSLSSQSSTSRDTGAEELKEGDALEGCRSSSLTTTPTTTRRPLPRRLADDGFSPTPFDFARTAGISKKPIGQGCQAVVFAVNPGPDSRGRPQKFAVKVLRPELAKVAEELRAFKREVNLLARLDHENLCRFVAVGTTPDNRPCVMLEWVETTLSHALKLGDVGRDASIRAFVARKFPNGERLRLVSELAESLRYLHFNAIPGHVVLHRDLKPDNYGLSVDGTFKLLDFGLAVVLENAPPDDEDGESDSVTSLNAYDLTGETGSCRYMSPEVGRCEPYGCGVDVYGFAISAWEILALRGKPYADLDVKSHEALVLRGQTRPPLPSKWDADLAALIRATWAPDAAKRPTFDHVVDALHRIRDGPGGDPLNAAGRSGKKGCVLCS